MAPEPQCYILGPGTCRPEVYALVLNDTALVKDYIVVGRVDGSSGSSDMVSLAGDQDSAGVSGVGRAGTGTGAGPLFMGEKLQHVLGDPAGDLE